MEGIYQRIRSWIGVPSVHTALMQIPKVTKVFKKKFSAQFLALFNIPDCFSLLLYPQFFAFLLLASFTSKLSHNTAGVCVVL